MTNETREAAKAPTLLNRNKLSMVRRRARHSRHTPLIIGPPSNMPTIRHTHNGMLCKTKRCSRSTSDRLTASATVMLLNARNAPIAILHQMVVSGAVGTCAAAVGGERDGSTHGVGGLA